MTEENKITKNKEWFKYFYYGIIGIVVFLLIFLPIIVFILKFHSYSISDKLNDWSAFGSYIGGIYALYNFIAFIFLAYFAYRIDKKIAYNQIKQNIYNTYFNQINYLFFEVLKKYENYKKVQNPTTQNELKVSIELYKMFIDNLKYETISINSDKEFFKKINENIIVCELFNEKFHIVPDNDRDEFFKNFIKSKTVLINIMFRNIKVN